MKPSTFDGINAITTNNWNHQNSLRLARPLNWV